MNHRKSTTILKAVLLFFALQLSSAVFSQQNSECGNIYNKELSRYSSSLPTIKSGNPLVVIPVVIHVLYNNSAGNLTNSEVDQILDQLNKDFSKMNGYTANIPAVWDTIATNTNIQFCLAQRDPTGAPSSGIERRNTFVNQFNDQTSMKYHSSGGLDAWDPSNYFNIWICNYNGTGSAHAFGVPPSFSIDFTYGAVVNRAWVGVGVTTLTHEVGHCLGLDHIWGDDQPGCSSDYIADTPDQEYASAGCLTFPWVDNCSPNGNGRMFMNFMDYSDCRSMFTQGQANKMHAVLYASPYNQLALSNGCTPVILQANDAGAHSILSPTGEICNSDTLNPVIVMRNWGTNLLQSTTITYQVGSSLAQTYFWSGNLQSLAFDTIQLPSIISGSGSQVISVSTSIPNGLPDQNTNNDLTTSSVFLRLTGNNLPLFYGFEDLMLPPADWSLAESPYIYIASRSTEAFTSGIAALKVDMTYAQDQEVRLTTPNVDLTSTTFPKLSFELAYRMRYDPADSYIDSLEVFISKDCGESWESIYEKYGHDLATLPTIELNDFIPNLTDWRLETIDLESHQGSSNVMFQFKFSCTWGGIIWVDDINISGDSYASIEENSNSAPFSMIYPNPNSGQFSVSLPYLHSTHMNIEVINSMGQIIFTENKTDLTENKINIDLPTYAKGMYLLKLTNFESKKIETVLFEID